MHAYVAAGLTVAKVLVNVKTDYRPMEIAAELRQFPDHMT